MLGRGNKSMATALVRAAPRRTMRHEFGWIYSIRSVARFGRMVCGGKQACVLSSCITNPRMIDWEFNQPLLTVDALDANCCRLCARANSSNILLWVKQHINLYPTQSLVLLRMAAM
ncbi:uncharacterized protein [Triticum aestivum]|uniref:uncharacterized protein n=1 Tax=Triticum aestivum TaxID=4565 RepID=UPI001D01F01F|nr:uncharacterized protein LOC123163822 [Triticum aestivum]